MADYEKLPWELTEEIFSRVSPKSLVRFRTVCKRWKALFDDKRFINNHKCTFRFILATKSKIYSVSIDPEIVVRELTLDIPGLEESPILKIVVCYDFVLCRMDTGAVVWNPWLDQTRWIKTDVCQHSLEINGIGYDNNNGVAKSSYKAIAYHDKVQLGTHTVWKIHDFASDAWKWKDYKSEYGDGGGSSISFQARKLAKIHNSVSGISLNGSVYWVVYYDKTDPLYRVHRFDFLSESFSWFCHLPCGANHRQDTLLLRVFKEDRFSLLKQCHETKKIEVWVTKNKINHEDGHGVFWMSFMTFSVPNLPGLVQTGSYAQPSYFLEDKRLVVCSCDETGQAWIYVFGENKLMRKVKIVSVVDPWPLHCTYFPSLIPVPPPCQREKAELQV